MHLFANLSLFKAGWLLSVIGGAASMPWLGPAAVTIALVVHLRFARHPFEEIVLIACCAILGAGFDSLLVAAGWVSYQSGMFSELAAPYWIVTMWMLFATTLNVSMRWLRGRPGLAAFFGFYGGPAAYLAGQAIGAIELVEPLYALTALAAGWLFMMPLLVWLSENLDGMPGAPRNWLREQRS